MDTRHPSPHTKAPMMGEHVEHESAHQKSLVTSALDKQILWKESLWWQNCLASEAEEDKASYDVSDVLGLGALQTARGQEIENSTLTQGEGLTKSLSEE